MSDKQEEKADWTSPVEEVFVQGAVLAGTAVATALVGPSVLVVGAAGAAAAVAAKVVSTAIRGAAATRAKQRTELFESELVRAMSEQGDEAALVAQSEAPTFQEVIFQNYRRAMDAIEPSVVPALARLTSAYAFKRKPLTDRLRAHAALPT